MEDYIDYSPYLQDILNEISKPGVDMEYLIGVICGVFLVLIFWNIAKEGF